MLNHNISDTLNAHKYIASSSIFFIAIIKQDHLFVARKKAYLQKMYTYKVPTPNMSPKHTIQNNMTDKRVEN